VNAPLSTIAAVADTTARRLTSSRLSGWIRDAYELALRYPALAGFFGFAALIAALRPASYNAPIDQDTGQYLYLAQTVMHGGTPYVDAAYNKGPVTALLFIPIRLVAGGSTVGVRLTLLPFAALAALAVTGYVGRLAGRATGIVAGIAFAALSGMAILQGDDPNTEQYGVAFMAGALYFAVRGGWRSAAASGLCTAAAVGINPTFAVVVPFVLWELWRNGGPELRGRRFLSGIGGALLLGAPILIWLGTSGALGDMVTQIVGHARGSVGPRLRSTGPFTGALPPGGQHHSELYRLVNIPEGSLWVAALVGCLIALRDPRLRRVAIPAALWMVLSWARVKVVNYEFLHHYYPGLIGVVAGLAVGIAALWGTDLRRRIALTALVLAVPVWSLAIGPQWRALFVSAHARFGVDHPYALAYPVARFVREHTAPGDPIMVAGAEAQVYYLADRRAPTRFFDIFPVMDHPAYAAERESEMLSNPPRAVVLLPTEGIDPTLRAVGQQHAYRVAYQSHGATVFLLKQ
jgi:hypothetical protein